jgi:uncharacterized membrane protein SpoIIM required for sporulation
VKRGRFVAERSPDWDELERLLGERLDKDGVRRLGPLYRAAAADLAVARRAFPGDPLTARLHALVLRGRQAVYASEPRRASVLHFLTTGYWQRIRERPGLLATATVLLLVPAVLAWIWGATDPGAAIGVVPGAFRNRGGDPVAGSLSVSDEAGFAGEIFTNNIRVTFAAVAAGITLGLGSAALAIYNGVLLGALGGIAQHDGQAERFVALVTGHGVLELSCIVIATMAGLRIGFAIIDPGRRTRGAALRAEARPAMEIVLGTMPWLVLAGLVEGFFTGSAPSLTAAIVLGVGLGAVFWALVWLRGGRAPSP